MNFRQDYEPKKLEPYLTTPVAQKWSDLEVPVFTDVPKVLKDLGLAKQGKKMMEEQNRMIRMKHQIKVALTEASPVFDTEEPSKDPFDFTVTEIPNISMVKRQRMEHALEISALYNQQYRECAKDFLTDTVPAVKSKKRELEGEIRDLQLELESLKAGYNQKIQQKQVELNALMRGSNEVYKRFYLTDRGSAKDGGFIPCEHPRGVEWGYINLFQNSEQDETLENLLDVIDKIEHPEEGKPVSQTITPAFRDGSGSAAPFGGDLRMQSENDGLKGFVKSIFS